MGDYTLLHYCANIYKGGLHRLNMENTNNQEVKNFNSGERLTETQEKAMHQNLMDAKKELDLLEAKKLIAKEETKLEVVSDKIFGNPNKKNIYLILWERIANSGLIYCYADSEEEAYDNFSYKLNSAVKHTVIKLDRKNMPVTDNREKN